MNKMTVAQQAKTASFLSPAQGILQRKCACGTHMMGGGQCAECAKNKSGLQRKLAIGASNDPLEQEADRVADQVMAAPAHFVVSGAPPRIQRYARQATEGMGTAPASVDRVLASSGRPLDAALQQDMEQRFGHDFSRVRVHSGAAAEQSARDVNAQAYTVGHDIVFGTGRFAPRTYEGRRLIAHELTHVLQQSVPILGRRLARQPLKEEGELLPGGVGMERTVPAGTKRSLPSTLQFYHGTRWSIAQNIGRIEPRGIGDFAAAFYTHFEPDNNQAALNRAKERGRWAARQAPQEPHAGVLNFQVSTNSFVNLLNTRSRVFPLRDLQQPDYSARQREWLSYITTHGRESNPEHFADQYNVERWRHFELKSPSVAPNALTIGPFYTPRQGLPGQPPPPSEFQPKALEPVTAPTLLQQQVAWANEGIDLLNASPRNTLQFDRETGAPIDPPIPATVAPPPFSQHYTSQNPSDE